MTSWEKYIRDLNDPSRLKVVVNPRAVARIQFDPARSTMSTVTIHEGVTAEIDEDSVADFHEEFKAVCEEYNVDPQQLTESPGPFQADLMALLKSYGFKATEAAPDLFDELKKIG